MPYPMAAVRGKGFNNPQYSDLILSLSPLAYWPLSDLSGTAAVELVAARNGTYAGVDLAQAQAPYVAPLFGGSGDSCNIYSAGLAGAFSAAAGSISIWAKVYDAGVWTDGAYRNLITFYVDGSNSISIQRSSTNGRVSWFYIAGGTQEQRNKESLSTTAWVHLALTWSVADDKVIAYYNGAQEGATMTTLGTWAGALSNNNTAIGCFRVTTALQVWNGWLAHAALWTRALTAAEVANLYAWGM